MFSIKFCVLILIVLNIIEFAWAVNRRPKLVTTDGNLDIIGAWDRNITLRSSGSGYININGENLLQITHMAYNASLTINRLRSSYLDRFDAEIKRLSALVENNNGTSINSNASPISPFFSPSLMNRRIVGLRRRISKLEIDFADLKSNIEKDECVSNPCRNGGRCQDLFNNFLCWCPDNWEGPQCDVDVNECTKFIGTDLGCQNGGTCINKAGSYECICPPGWYGLHCTRKTNDCDSASSQELCGHGICVSQKSGYTCICDPGWKTDGVHPACTVDIDECAGDHPHCSRSPSVKCINVPGKYYCGSCPAGYTGTGYYCTDIDECLQNNGGCSMLPQVQCINTLGGSYCGPCPPGYQGDGRTCTQNNVGACGVNNGGCSKLATCMALPQISPSAVQCTCPYNYMGNGIGDNGCVLKANSINMTTGPCATIPCGQNGNCKVKNNNDYECSCINFYTGRNCDILDSCTLYNSPCKNGGSCSNTKFGWVCDCDTLYYGQRCEYQKEECGGYLSKESGKIDYPLNRTNYDSNMSCAWTIATTADKVLNITFSKFDLEKGSGTTCLYDWLQIHDGQNSAAHNLGRYCGSKLPGINGHILTTGNKIYIWFRSDSRTNKAGFSLTWTSKRSSCNGFYLTNSHGTLKSPGSPGKYPPNRDCDYVILAPREKRIQFHFFIMVLGDNPDCNSDYLEIYDGWTKRDPLLAKYCKTSHPEPITTSGHVAYIHFHSDSVGNYDGFQITYSVEPGIPGCGGVYTTPSGELRNPTITDNYFTTNIECEYLIRVANGSRIKLTYLEMNLKESTTCNQDYIEIREGPQKYPERKNFITKYCGKNIPPIWTSTSNEVVVRYHSNFVRMTDLQNFGYRIRYDMVCGGIFNDPTGVIISPNFPDDSWKFKTCEYLISVPISSAIKLRFTQFNVGSVTNATNQSIRGPRRFFGRIGSSPPRIFPEESSQNQSKIDRSSSCSKMGITVYDGDSNKALKIGDYCGTLSDVPYSITSTHNHLFIEYRNLGTPFRLRYGMVNFRFNYSSIQLGCGGILKDSIGVIKSPNDLAAYPTNTICKWLIMAPPGFIVQLTWVNFDLEQSYNCSADYVRVYDETVIPGKSKPLGTYCGKKLPPLIVSTSNVLHIEFKSDSSKTDEGFIANYVMRDESKICGRPYFASYGTFSSPGYPDGYPRSKDCVWTITVPNGQQIMLNITDFEIEQHLDCRFDYLEIRNGGYETSPLIGKFCGKGIPKIITSHSNELWIHFKSDASRSAKGFSLTWDGTSIGCGGSLSAWNGHIISPNYPKSYGRNTDCFWKIITSAGSLLQISFFDIDLESSAFCRLDYVEIHEGLRLTNNPIGRYCNSMNVPAVINSKTNELFIKFRSDTSYEGHGFNLKYTTVCNNIIKGHRGILESPNYPNEYPVRVDCLWKITVPNGNKINITFTHFDLEELRSQSTKCTNVDYVEIKETRESDQKEIDIADSKKLCGKELPDPITSSFNNVYIRFKSDAALSGTGFRLEWVIEGCGGELTHPEGSIISPNYPKYYPLNTVCEWVIKVDYDSSIQLTIHDLEIERIYSCDFDNLAIHNGADETAPVLAKICATKKNVTLTSSGNLMYVRFTSDASFQGKGFNITYKRVPIRCGGLFTANEGIITSKNYPKNYDNKDDCYWLIVLPKTYLIRLTFDDFDTETHKNCTQDYVNVYDGNTTTAPLLLNHCGNTLPVPVTYISTDNTMLIHMSTDALFAAKGFRANYTIQCGAHIITDSSGVIDFTESGIQNNNYGENCTWTIESKKPGGHISLTITHLDIREDYSFDEGDDNSLHIYNGLDNTSALIGVYKNHKIPPTIVSEGSALHLYLPITYSTTAFVASYSALSTACGGQLTSLAGEFGSVGYPKNYPNDMDCVWKIQPAEGNLVSLTFQSFDLDDSENCNEDFVEIREGSSTANVIKVLCGHKELSAPIKASKLWIRFRSDSEGTQKGFLASYTLEFGNQNITGSEGRIQSPYYPNYYRDSEEITWKITTGMFNVVLFRFDDFTFNSWDDSGCSESYYGFKIYDGDSDQGELLLAECNRNTPPAPVVTTRNIATIKLATASDYWRGSLFNLRWNSIRRSDVSKYIEPPKPANCGSDEVINLDLVNNITIQSPGYPYGYDSKLLCTWTFTTNQNNHVALKFLDVDLEVQPNCISDSVTIYTSLENTDKEQQTLGKYCLQNATNIKAIHGKNLMKIEFKTNAWYNKTGFKARLFSACGGSINGRSGIINVDMDQLVKTHPRYSDYPESFYNCNWNITVRPGRRIKVKFELFLNNGTMVDDGCYNFVMLKNGLTNDAPLLGIGKYCETDKALMEIPETSGNTLGIRYKGHNPLTNLNFRLRYTEVSQSCGDTITLTKWNNATNITSPNYPEIPHPYTECEWIIRAPPGEALSINFLERIDVTYSSGCTKAGIEVRDGASIRSPLLLLHCAYHGPPTKFSTSNVLYIRFYTNVPEPKNGFKADIAIATCGGTIIPTQNFTVSSPNYPVPGSLTKDLQCTWKIIVPQYRGIKIIFNDIHLPKPSMFTNNCSTTAHLDFIETDFNTTLLESVCGSTNLNKTITSYGSYVTVTFTTAGKVLNYYKGFSFNITQTYLKDCGGKLSGPEGVFESPNYGLSVRRSQVCKWIITVPEGRRVTLQVVDFEKVSSRVGLSDVGLSFFNRERENYIQLLKSNIFIPNMTIESSQNYLYVYYWSFTNNPHKGFKAKWTSNEPSICVGSFNDEFGTIYEPPHHNSLYAKFRVYYCEWQHKSTNPNPETLAITVQKLDMQGTLASKCSYASNVLKIFDENGGYNNPLQEFCATLTQPEIIRSPYKLTTLAVSQSNQPFNYTVNYKVYKCGGQLNDHTFKLDIHGDKQIPGDQSECVWIGTYAEGSRIRLTFLRMNLDTNCANEYVSIKNGNRHNSPEIGKFCGKNIPNVIISQSNKIWIEFHSNNTSNDRSKPGFHLRMEEEADGCGGIYHADEMIIKSPNHPKAYPPNTDCTWEARATSGNTIGLFSIDTFQIEETPNCANDFVEVWDYVDDKNWKHLGRFCGRDFKTQNSTSNRMKIRFRSNNKTQGTGFQLKWSANCGGVFQVTPLTQRIVSPGYPRGYDNLRVCNYTLIAKQNVDINLEFTDFSLETGRDQCNFDNVTIFSKRWMTSSFKKDWGTYCGEKKPPQLTLKTYVEIIFRTDAWITRRGFAFQFSTSTCGAIITQPTTISNPKDKEQVNRYAHDSNCYWNITAPPDKLIHLRFQKFDLEFSTMCRFDYINVYDGYIADEKYLLKKLCGFLKYPTVRSTQNHMLIQFHSDSSSNFGGFDAEIIFTYGPNQGCGGQIDLLKNETSKTLTLNPALKGSDGMYLPFLDCHWNFKAPSGYVIKIEFTSVHISICPTIQDAETAALKNKTAVDRKCTCDFIQLNDGASDASDMIFKHCGHTLPNTVTTSTNYAWLRFVSDGDVGSTGFVLNLSLEKSICGDTVLYVTNDAKTLTSPNYPNNYPANTRCMWYLVSKDPIDRFDIHFEMLEMENADTDGYCSNDRLEITDKVNLNTRAFIAEGSGTKIFNGGNSRPQSAIYRSRVPSQRYIICSSSLPLDYYSGVNNVQITFVSNAAIQKKGFKMTYRQIGCNRNFTAEQGRIQVQKILQQNCVITITAPKNRTISLYFQTFFIFDMGNCSNSGISVLDGLDKNSKEIMRFCGLRNPNSLHSSGNALTINLWNRRLNKIDTLDVMYTTTDQGPGCGGKLFNYGGKFTSPNYPNVYNKTGTCVWEVSTPQGTLISLQFVYANLGSKQTCETDYIELYIRNAQSGIDRQFGRFCGDDLGAPRTILDFDTNTVIVKYTTSNKNIGTGWEAMFMSKTRD